MLAFAFFEAPALRVSSVGRGLSLYLALAVAISPRNTRPSLQIVFALARNALLVAVFGAECAGGGSPILTLALFVYPTNGVFNACASCL